MNSNLLGHVWETHSLIISLLNSVYSMVFLIMRIYGFDNVAENGSIIALNMAMGLIVIPIWINTNLGLVNYSLKKANLVGKI